MRKIFVLGLAPPMALIYAAIPIITRSPIQNPVLDPQTTFVNIAPPGASIAVAGQTFDNSPKWPNFHTAVFVDKFGRLCVTRTVGENLGPQAWEGPVPISDPDFALPGAPVAL